jgi:hypothetical protein
MKPGEQPLRDKSRGRVIHVSDFILERDGRLVLTDEEREAQAKLPVRPSPPSSTPNPPPAELQQDPNTKKSRKKKAADPAAKPSQVRSFTELEDEWKPPPPPAPFTSYRLNTFDARKIIYPGANHDPWWDMPQLIAQVGTHS